MDDAESTMSAGAPTPPKPPRGDPPGLRSQLGTTAGGFKRLLSAHVDLAKTEVGEIVDEVKRTVALAGVAIGILIFAALLLAIGGILFLGEWLFGSIGWGVLLGFLLFLDVAVIALLVALDVKGARLATSLLVAAILGVVVGLVLAFDLPHRGWEALGQAVIPGFDPATQTTWLAIGVLAAIGALVGLALGWRSGGLGSGIGFAIALAILGAFLGWLTSITVAAQVGAAIGVFVALVAWPVFAGLDVMRKGIDTEALGKKFIPNQTIDLTKETLEWVRARTPLVPKS